MIKDNTFNQSGIFSEPTPGEKLSNLKTTHKVFMKGREYIIKEESTLPKYDGTFEDTETIYVHIDPAGNPIPENPNNYIYSYSGICVPPEKAAICTSKFHWGNRSKTIAIGHDGRLTERGAICSHCESWQNTSMTVIVILIIGGFIGLIKAIFNF
ncbi:hypothetical protein [Desulfosarcina variabilis]|uniref:hypothetical protein n=1 Tax=Desulfosarcina variabilis TaxID=2300 RepID=UPI003AFB13CD